LGIVNLKILYDDDVYGARIVAVEHNQVSFRRISPHLIYFQLLYYLIFAQNKKIFFNPNVINILKFVE